MQYTKRKGLYMIRKEKLKVGLFVWWHVNRKGELWSCPAKIISVRKTENSFTVLCFDDFEKHKLDIEKPIYQGDSALHEMREVKEEEVKSYLSQRNNRELLSQIRRNKAWLKKYKVKAAKFGL